MRYLTSGESHGSQLTAIIEGVPAGLKLTADMINQELQERQQGYGRGDRMKIERDRVKIVGGVRHGFTLGSPISLVINNKDNANWGQTMAVEPIENLEYEVKEIPRPGHADLVGAIKYGHRDLRNVLERSSARETAIRVAVGAVAKQILKVLEIEVQAHVLQIGSVGINCSQKSIADIRAYLLKSPVRCMDEQASKQMCEAIDQAKAQGDSLGGIVQIIAENVPAGVGSYVHYDRKLDAKLAAAIMSVQSVKGVHFGDALFSSTHSGSEVHDQIQYGAAGFTRKTNHYGGFEGGMTNGMPLVMEALVKPIPTLYQPLDSIHLETKEIKESMIERSDCCVVPAAGVVLEAVVAIELATEILSMFESDQVERLIQSFENYRNAVKGF